MKIGLLGGTFDPIHNGHLSLARAARRQLRLQRVFFVLSPRSPFKMNQQLSTVPDRLNLLRAALRADARFSVGAWELDRRGPSYTVTTLAQLRRLRPNDQLFLILGSDAFRGFRRWKNPEKIRRLATLVVGRRPGTTIAPKNGVVTLRGIFPKISSTRIRARARAGASLAGLVPTAVARIIRQKGIYR